MLRSRRAGAALTAQRAEKLIAEIRAGDVALVREAAIVSALVKVRPLPGG